MVCVPDADWSPPADLPPTLCDICQSPTTHECGLCGEAYCSRECMRSAWHSKGGSHRTICEQIFETSSGLAATLTRMEMAQGEGGGGEGGRG